MTYLSRKMDEQHLERQFRNELETLRERTEIRLEALERPAASTAALAASPNYLRNSHPEWSTKAYTQSDVFSGDTDDLNLECYNWYYVEAGENPSTLTPLLADGHSDFAALPADAPVWDKVNARFALGWDSSEASPGVSYELTCPLPTDFVFPSQRYFVVFETLLDDASVTLGDAELYCGFWDSTTGQETWIEGDDFTPTATVFGAAGTRSLAYKIRATTDGGFQILSTEAVVPNAPAALSANNHIRLSFRGAPGFIRFEIFRKDGAVYRKVADIRNSTDLQFFDLQEEAGSIEAEYPTLALSRPRAYASTNGLTGNVTSYTLHTMVVPVPSTYNRSQTENGKQWFKIGFTAPISVARKLYIRRIMLSEGYGPWTRADRDLQALSSPSASATGSPGGGILIETGGGGVGGGIENGPVDCVTLDAMIDIVRSDGESMVVERIPISELEAGMYVLSGPHALKVAQIRDGVTQEVYRLETDGGMVLECSPSHRVIRTYLDKYGTSARLLQEGDPVLTSVDGHVKVDRIRTISVRYGTTPVRSISIPEPHLYVVNGVVSHNKKVAPVEPTQG